jgi:hypothetical protein
MRQVHKLLRLSDKYGNGRTDDACGRALGFDLIDVKRVQSIIEKAIEKAAHPKPGQLSLMPQESTITVLNPRFVRDPRYLSIKATQQPTEA